MKTRTCSRGVYYFASIVALFVLVFSLSTKTIWADEFGADGLNKDNVEEDLVSDDTNSESVSEVTLEDESAPDATSEEAIDGQIQDEVDAENTGDESGASDTVAEEDMTDENSEGELQVDSEETVDDNAEEDVQVDTEEDAELEPVAATESKGDTAETAEDSVLDEGEEIVLASTNQSVKAGIKRISGKTKYDTAIQVAENLKKTLGKSQFDTMLIARGDHYADSLSGNYLATVKDAPIILMSNNGDYNNNTILNYIKKNLSTNGKLYILGGRKSIPQTIENALKKIGEVVRLGGKTQYDTNLKILIEAIDPEANKPKPAAPKPDNQADTPAEGTETATDTPAEGTETAGEENETGADAGGTESAEPTLEEETPEIEPIVPEVKLIGDLLVATGTGFPDALAGSALGSPILLVGTDLTENQKSFLEKYLTKENNIIILGGSKVVSKPIEANLKKYTKTSRVSGKTKYDTAIAIAEKYFPGTKHVAMATGDQFSDALVGGVYANKNDIPILLTSTALTSSGPEFAKTYKHIYTSKIIKAVTVFGGSGVVPVDVIGMKENGTRKSGFLNVRGNKFYAYSDGTLAKSKFITSSSKKYYAGSNCVIYTNRTFTASGDTWVAAKDGTVSKPSKIIYLTFDDGPGPYTEKLIRILNKYGAKATFFINGTRSYYNDLIKMAYNSGHAIGNHTYSHDYGYVYSSTGNFWADVNKLNNIIKAQTGKTTNLLRFPGGSSNLVSTNYSYGIMSALARQSKEKGYAYFDWNVDSNDAGGTVTSGGVYSNIVNGVSGRKESVVLCHDIKGYTVNAIEDVIKWGQRNGYTFLALNSSSPTAHHGIAN